MDQLVSPGGDPWKREQTHQTLARFMLEEAYEAIDAIDAHDLAALREELGDVLLQVVLHARMAEEADPPWSIDDVAATLVDKLVRRNPHVFAGLRVTGIDEITDNWERIKRASGPEDGMPFDGIAWGQPALGPGRQDRPAGRPGRPPVAPSPWPATRRSSDGLLFALVVAAATAGLDAEGALRREALTRADAARTD
jgi:XTP/dITP diphosphohydrolase